jgi:subtilisin family serine protease
MDNETVMRFPSDSAAQLTGRTIITFADDFDIAPLGGLAMSGVTAAGADFDGPTFFPNLGIAIVPGGMVFAQAMDDRIIAVEPERRVYAIDTISPAEPAASGVAPLSSATWGIDAVGATRSNASGAEVIVAVLDTGFDVSHQDFIGRRVISKSFVPGQSVDDGNGHGTHCIGTACGPLASANEPRYGVAHACSIAVGKVLGDDGTGIDAWTLAGIDWAVEIGARVISLSLGAPAFGAGHSAAYEAAASRAMRRGTIIVAAAGNESRRPQDIQPVCSPANCPSILSVASLARDLTVSEFSCGQANLTGGEVNVAAPGERIRSAAPGSRYATRSGTSMAAPHVAGIAALHLQLNPRLTPNLLWKQLEAACLPLPAQRTDVGHGIVQAP